MFEIVDEVGVVFASKSEEEANLAFDTFRYSTEELMDAYDFSKIEAEDKIKEYAVDVVGKLRLIKILEEC